MAQIYKCPMKDSQEYMPKELIGKLYLMAKMNMDQNFHKFFMLNYATKITNNYRKISFQNNNQSKSMVIHNSLSKLPQLP